MPELEKIESLANFSTEQKQIYYALNSNQLCDFAIMAKYNIPKGKYYSEKCIVIDKVERLSRELGYEHVFSRRIIPRQ